MRKKNSTPLMLWACSQRKKKLLSKKKMRQSLEKSALAFKTLRWISLFADYYAMLMMGEGPQLLRQPQQQLLLLLLLSALSVVVPVVGSPDPGRWTFNNISSEQNYIGGFWKKKEKLWLPYCCFHEPFLKIKQLAFFNCVKCT
jgi:hypothetical protein